MENIIELSSSSKRWEVLQPPIYLISIIPGLVWAILLPPTASLLLLFLTTLAVVFIQHGVNVLNDAIDWKKGADSQKELSWVHFHHLNLRTVRFHGIAIFLLGVAIGIAIVAHVHAYELLLVALPLVTLGYGYNASQWTLSYTALGEWVTGLCYGPGVFGCMGYLFLGKINPTIIFGSISFGCLAVAVLFSHQPPQILNDFLAGKSSFAVRYGAQKTFLFSKILTTISLVLLTTIISRHFSTSFSVLLMLTSGIVVAIQAIQTQSSPKSILRSALILTSIGLIIKYGEVLT